MLKKIEQIFCILDFISRQVSATTSPFLAILFLFVFVGDKRGNIGARPDYHYNLLLVLCSEFMVVVVPTILSLTLPNYIILKYFLNTLS